MKNIIILIILLNISTNSFSQDKSICGEINYTQVLNIGFNIFEEENYLMKFNNNVSYSEEININSSDDKTITEDNKQSGENRRELIIPGRSNLAPKFYYNLKKEFYFSIIFGGESLFVKENKNKWKWKLHQETKKIGNFTCQKATIKFRGRTYTAWFTNEIPVSFGPWKFQGLTGLILEVYDTDKIFHIITTKIKVNNTANCNIDFDKKQLDQALTILEYQKRRDEIIKNLSKKTSSRVPKGAVVRKSKPDCKDCPKGLEIFDEEN